MEDKIVWDFLRQHLTDEDINEILEGVKAKMAANGVDLTEEELAIAKRYMIGELSSEQAIELMMDIG